MTSRKFNPLLLAAALAVVPCACREEPQVRQYQAPKSDPRETTQPAPSSTPTVTTPAVTTETPTPPMQAPPLGAVIESIPADSPITYAPPEGWRMHAPSGMRVATLSAGPEDLAAVSTVVPLAGPAGGLYSNVNRWRGQVGLPPLGEEAIDTSAHRIEIDGSQGYYFDLIGSERAILGVIVTRGDTTWFIKIDGPSPIVTQEKDRFEALARSIRFK